jgi:hypothetical protein
MSQAKNLHEAKLLTLLTFSTGGSIYVKKAAHARFGLCAPSDPSYYCTVL